MTTVEDPIVKDRQVPFEPDEILFLNYCVSKFTPIVPVPTEQAELMFEEETKNEG